MDKLITEKGLKLDMMLPKFLFDHVCTYYMYKSLIPLPLREVGTVMLWMNQKYVTLANSCAVNTSSTETLHTSELIKT